MTKPRVVAPCFLCNERSTYVEIDSGNRRFYDCFNPDCGAYEISTKLMKEKKGAEDFKYFVMENAHEGRATGHYLNIERKEPNSDELALVFKPR